jgi:uncharacterized protein YcbX
MVVVTEAAAVGSVVALWRFPVKSMQGEELNASLVTERGLLGDRAFALVEPGGGRVASAKNPRKWPDLFSFRAAFAEQLRGRGPFPPVRITLPDGTELDDKTAERDQLLCATLGRKVSLLSAPPEAPVLEEYWPDIEGLPHRDAVTNEALPAGTFFDVATVHLLTTATIDRLRELYPQGRFEVRRFRPNLVIACDSAAKGFVEQDWVDRTLQVGDEVRLRVTRPCGRCVMTTLPQADLPGDPGILRAAVRHCRGHVGVYARVLQGGTIRRGNSVSVS